MKLLNNMLRLNNGKYSLSLLILFVLLSTIKIIQCRPNIKDEIKHRTDDIKSENSTPLNYNNNTSATAVVPSNKDTTSTSRDYGLTFRPPIDLGIIEGYANDTIRRNSNNRQPNEGFRLYFSKGESIPDGTAQDGPWNNLANDDSRSNSETLLPTTIPTAQKMSLFQKQPYYFNPQSIPQSAIRRAIPAVPQYGFAPSFTFSDKAPTIQEGESTSSRGRSDSSKRLDSFPTLLNQPGQEYLDAISRRTIVPSPYATAPTILKATTTSPTTTLPSEVRTLHITAKSTRRMDDDMDITTLNLDSTDTLTIANTDAEDLHIGTAFPLSEDFTDAHLMMEIVSEIKSNTTTDVTTTVVPINAATTITEDEKSTTSTEEPPVSEYTPSEDNFVETTTSESVDIVANKSVGSISIIKNFTLSPALLSTKPPITTTVNPETSTTNYPTVNHTQTPTTTATGNLTETSSTRNITESSYTTPKDKELATTSTPKNDVITTFSTPNSIATTNTHPTGEMTTSDNKKIEITTTSAPKTTALTNVPTINAVSPVVNVTARAAKSTNPRKTPKSRVTVATTLTSITTEPTTTEKATNESNLFTNNSSTSPRSTKVPITAKSIAPASPTTKRPVRQRLPSFRPTSVPRPTIRRRIPKPPTSTTTMRTTTFSEEEYDDLGPQHSRTPDLAMATTTTEGNFIDLLVASKIPQPTDPTSTRRQYIITVPPLIDAEDVNLMRHDTINEHNEESGSIDGTLVDTTEVTAVEGAGIIPEGATNAIIISGIIGGCAILFFAVLTIVCLWRQHRSRRPIYPPTESSNSSSSSSSFHGKIG